MEAAAPPTASERASAAHGRCPPGCSASLPLLLIAAAIGAFAALGGPGLGERRGPPVEELAVEKTVLKPGRRSS